MAAPLRLETDATGKWSAWNAPRRPHILFL